MSYPMRPYGALPEPVYEPPPPLNRPDVPVNPPDPGTPTNGWHPGTGWRDENFPWLSGRKEEQS